MKLNPRLLNEARRVGLAIAATTGLGLIGGILAIFQAREVSRVISKVFLQNQALPAVQPFLVIILLLILLRAGFSWAGEVSAVAAARRIKQEIRQRLFSHLMDIGPAYLRSEAGDAQVRTGELVNTLTEGVDALEVYFSQYLPQIALAALLPIAILIFVFRIDLLSGIIFLVTAPLLPLFMWLIGSAAEALTRRQWLGMSRMSAYFLDVLQGLATLKTFGRSREQIAVIRKVSENYRQTTMSVLRVTFLSALALELVATLSTAVVAVEIGLRLLYGRLLFEQAFFLLLLAPEFYQPLRLLGTRFHGGMAGVEAARRIYEILDLPAAHPANSLEQTPGRKITPPAISFQDVSYTYSSSRAALQDISLEIHPGTLTALVGESGAGKTTLTWLLSGFLQPQSGNILVDGVSLADIPYEHWLQCLAWVPQNPYLFNDTIFANIKFARPGATELEVREAARQAYADQFIRDLPLGYQTPIGERGMRLSAGQAQRIALARAFLKEAPLIIFDEATSHLDPHTDTLVRASMQRLCAGRTVLVIAHHQSTLSMADQVVTLSHGKLVEITEHPQVISPVQELAQPDLPLPGPVPVPATLTPSPGTQHLSHIRSSNRPAEVRLIQQIYPYARYIALSVLLGFATVASGVGLMAAAAYIISAAALHPSIAELQVAIVGVRFFGLSRGVFRYLERLVSHDTTLRLLAGWRAWFYQALEPLAPARLLGYHTGDLLTRISSDINSLETFFVRSIAPPFVASLVVIAITLFIASFGSALAWGLLLFLVVAGFGLPLFSLATSRRLGPEIIGLRALLSTLLVDGLQGMPDILACGQAGTYTARVIQAGARLSERQARLSMLAVTQSVLSSLLANLGMLAVLTLGIQRVAQGQLDGIFLGVVTLAALTCFEALQPLPLAAQNYAAHRAAISRLYELVDAAPAVSDPPQPLPLPAVPDLQVSDLAFQYPLPENDSTSSSPETFSLQDICFSLPHGKHLALVGPSGAGKSTLVSLLLRFWDYPHGSILFGQQELRDYRQEDLRKHVAVVSQNTYLFSATIKENLLIACPNATDGDIELAVSRAQLHDYIASLPEGFHTWIGEHGLRLSTGERQRLAVARALLVNAPLLILDEPSASLDPATQLSLLESIRKATTRISTLTITQSLVGLEYMDEILVLSRGRIIERGTHPQLLAQGGAYFHMWELFHQEI